MIVRQGAPKFVPELDFASCLYSKLIELKMLKILIDH